MARPRKRTLDKQAAADALGVVPDTINRWRLRGMPSERGDGAGKPHMYNLHECMEWCQREGVQGRPGGTADPAEPSGLAAAKLEKENALARRYKLQADREEGLLVTVESVRRQMQAVVVQARDELLQLGPTHADQIADFDDPDDVERIITEKIEGALRSLESRLGAALDAAMAEEKSAA